MSDVLLDMKKTKDYLVCIDSDGCMLDNMELKHKECFTPATINCWNFQGASKYVREVAEYVNLYSKTRGFNRFPALIRTLELSYERPELIERGYKIPDLTPLKNWIDTTPVLGAAALEDYYSSHPNCDPILKQAAEWSREVDANIKHIVRNILPFPGVKEAIITLSEFADVVVVSATPHDALVRELESVGIAPLVSAIAGQEIGTKAICIKKAMSHGYTPDHVLKIGDAPADYKAATDNGVLFNPIVPGKEKESWLNIKKESSVRFKNEEFKGNYENALLDEFMSSLSDTPPWL